MASKSVNIYDAMRVDDLTTLKSILLDQCAQNYPYPKLLYKCVKFVCPNICRYLMEKVVDINVIDEITGLSALHRACLYSNLEIVKLLLQRSDMKINTCDRNGQTALHAMCYHHENIEIVKQLIANGADINLKDSHNETPFSYACASKSGVTIKELMKAPQLVIDNTNKHVKTIMKRSQ